METASTTDLSNFIQNVPQIVPESWCANCRICCRFPAQEKVQTPVFSNLEAEWALKQGGSPDWFRKEEGSPSLTPNLHTCASGWRCPAFESDTRRCSIYPVRPLDCRIYPFVLTRDAAGTRATLNMDMKCPYLEAHGRDPEVTAYALGLARYLETQEGLAYLKTNPQLVGKSWPEFFAVAALPAITQTVHEERLEPPPGLKPFSFEDAALLKKFLLEKPHTHSGYTVAGLLGWQDLIRIWSANLSGSLCLFAEQGGGFFMPVPPLGKDLKPSAVESCWEILTQLNRGSGVSRIEGIELCEISLFKSAGFELKPGEPEYLYRREDLVNLKGNRYRSQRWALNKASRGRSYLLRPFEEADLIPCLQLYTHWGIKRQQANPEPYVKALIRDGLFFHRRLMIEKSAWNLTGRVLEVEGRVLGYTFGQAVSEDTFCIFLEITDRELPGLSQLIFREFCRQLHPYDWINAMGDSSLHGLTQAKESYRPGAFTLTYKAKAKI